MTIKLGDANDTVLRWRQVMNAMFGGLYTRLMGPLPVDTNQFGPQAREWQQEFERRTGQIVDGVVSDQDLLDLKIVRPHRKIWIFTAPGSGAPWWIGPPFDLGEWCKAVLNINHQPVGYPIGGYLGLMGGDPAFSYLDVCAALDAEYERLLDTNPDVQEAMAIRANDWTAPVEVEIWVSGYSQSADAFKRAVQRLFGPGGKYERLRDRINGIIVLGDPTARGGRTKVGNTPPGRGIAAGIVTFDPWLENLVWNITNQSPTPDFYACTTDKIRPLFYEWFIRADTELPFVIYTAQIIIPALLNLIAPFLGGLAGLGSPLALPILAGATGAPAGVLAPIVGGVLGSTEKPNPELIKLLSIQGLLTSAPDLIALLMAVPGVGVHGDYYAPKPEFGGRSGVQVACDIVAGFHR